MKRLRCLFAWLGIVGLVGVAHGQAGQPDRLIVQIDRQGSMRVLAEDVAEFLDEEASRERIASVLAAEPNTPVLVHPDVESRNRQVSQVLRYLSELGAEAISLMTERDWLAMQDDL